MQQLWGVFSTRDDGVQMTRPDFTSAERVQAERYADMVRGYFPEWTVEVREADAGSGFYDPQASAYFLELVPGAHDRRHIIHRRPSVGEAEYHKPVDSWGIPIGFATYDAAANAWTAVIGDAVHQLASLGDFAELFYRKLESPPVRIVPDGTYIYDRYTGD